MNKKEELGLLMQAVESVDVLVDGEAIDNMADLAGVEPTDELKRLIFAENLQNELQDLLTAEEPETIGNVCPPLKEKWDIKTIEAIEQAFRCGYYYAMTQAGQSWQTNETDRIMLSKLAKKMQLIPPKYAIFTEGEGHTTDKEEWDLTDNKTLYLEGKALKLWEYWMPESYAHAERNAIESVGEDLIKGDRNEVINNRMVEILREEKDLYNKLMTRAEQDSKTFF